MTDPSRSSDRPTASPLTASARPRAGPPSPADGFWARRLGWEALRYPIPPAAATLRYSLGALTFASLVVLVLSGLWLAQYYNPSPTAAHDSVLYIITRAPLGDLARNLHYWSASALVISIVGHIVWVFWRRAYRAPRELTWYVGVGLAASAFLMVVTGTMLRYDQEGAEALAHFLAGADMAGWFGRFFSGDFTLSAPVLTRVFGMHTSLLPLGIAALVAAHFWLVRVLGISAEGPRTAPFSEHLGRMTGASLLLIAILIGLAVLAPVGYGYPPVPGHEITKPFWPLLWIYALESLTGMWALIWAPLALFAYLAVVPLWDRGDASDGTPRVLRLIGLVFFLALVGLGLWAALSPPQQHLGM